MQRFISLTFRDGSNLWWCKEHRHFFNPRAHGYRLGASQPKHDAIALDDLSIHQREAEAWVLANIPLHARPVRLKIHMVKERKNARR